MSKQTDLRTPMRSASFTWNPKSVGFGRAACEEKPEPTGERGGSEGHGVTRPLSSGKPPNKKGISSVQGTFWGSEISSKSTLR